MIVAVLTRGSLLPRRKSSAKPWIDVRGVRSSCEASARNWRRRFSVASLCTKARWILVEHGVERRRQLVDLGALGADLYTLGQVTAGDLFSRVGHMLEWGEAPSQHQPRPHRKDHQQPHRPQQLDQYQPVERAGDAAGRQSDYDPVPVARPADVGQPARVTFLWSQDVTC